MSNNSVKSAPLLTDKQPKIDFAALPLPEVAATLRIVAQNLLLNLLYGGCRADWAVLLPHAQVQILVPPRQARLGRLRQWYNKIPGAKPAGWQEDMVTQAINGQLPPDRWRVRLIRRLGQNFNGIPPCYLPDNLWPVVSEMAWRDLDFQYWIATQVRAYFRPRLLFTLGHMPVATLSPATCWLLIALAGVSTPLLSSGFRTGQNSLDRAVKRLQREGQRQALTPGWAGFWDQWIALEALQRWPQACALLDPPLHQALLALPLVTMHRQKNRPESAPPRASKLSAATKFIQQRFGKPIKWLNQWRKVARPVTATPPELAAPNWNNDMPNWFDAYLNLIEQTSGGKG